MAGVVDVTLADHGTIVVVTGKTRRARDHLSEHMPDDAPRWGGGYVVEPRFVDFIVEDLLANDLVVEAE